MKAVVIYITASSEDEAATIGKTLVDEHLCACVNVIPGVRSFYRWEGRIEDDRESVLVAKTTEDRVEAVTERVKALHSADLPCVVALPVAGGNPPFLDWIAEETAMARDDERQG